MSSVIYACKRPNGEIINVNFPYVDSNFRMGNARRTYKDLVSDGFPVDATIFVGGAVAPLARQFGFRNVFAIPSEFNENWELDNGAKLHIESHVDESTDPVGFNVGVWPINPDGSYYFTGSSSVLPTLDPPSFQYLLPWCRVGNDEEGGIPWCSGYPGEMSFVYNNIISEGPYPLKFFADATPIDQPEDPYNGGGTSGPGGGGGDFTGAGEPVDIPPAPALSAADSGFITLFNPTLAQLNDLASYMWSDLFDINGWRKIFADPMQAILGLSIVPVRIPSSTTKPVKVGNISTTVNMLVADTQYIDLDCGSLDVKEFWGGYLDYDPYTKAELYLPYIGTHAISTDDIMGKNVSVTYRVDILSGACCAMVKCGDAVLYTFAGQCASSIPITGDNWTNVINGALSIAGSIGAMVATGGASAPMAAGMVAATATNTMKPTIEKSGALGGTSGLLGVQRPYLILTRPRQALPKNQNTYTGYPSFITESLSSLRGYTEIESIHLENVPATENELSEIESLLKGGVIF